LEEDAMMAIASSLGFRVVTKVAVFGVLVVAATAGDRMQSPVQRDGNSLTADGGLAPDFILGYRQSAGLQAPVSRASETYVRDTAFFSSAGPNVNNQPQGSPASGDPEDCNGNGIPDEFDLEDCDGATWCQDCNGNGIPDVCDLDNEPCETNGGARGGCEDFTVTAPGSWSGNTCGAGDDCDVTGSDNEDHEYLVTLPSSGEWTFSLCASDYDTKLMVGATCCSDDVGYNDDSCGLQSEITANLPAGAYYVVVDGYGAACGDYTLSITGGGSDECSDCFAVGEGTYSGTTADNTGTVDDTALCAFDDTIDEWYCYTASCTGTATASTCNAASFDTTLAVFDACDGTELACNDDGAGCSGFTSELTWDVTSGTTYYVRVSGWNGASGTYDLTLSCEGGGGDCTIHIEIFTDNFPSETTWDVVDAGGGTVASGGPLSAPATLHTWDIALDCEGCYVFTIYDTFGDGICCGYGNGWYEVSYEGALACSGAEFGFSETCSDIGSDCGGGDCTIHIEIMTDIYPIETTWDVVEVGGSVVAAGGPLSDPLTLHTWDVAVDCEGCYDFTIYDAWGDGICCGYGSGWYEVSYEGALACSGAEFGASEACSDIGGCNVPPPPNDCNENGIPDECDIADHRSTDCNLNCIPDECEGPPGEVLCGGIDIKPGSCPNPFNRNSHGMLPVALTGTDTFDVNLIDIPTVRLFRTGHDGQVAPLEGPPGPHTVIADVATPFEGDDCTCHELTGDGLDDLSMKFPREEIISALGLGDLPHGTLVPLSLKGNLLGGAAFTTPFDCILIVPLGPSDALVESSIPDLHVELSPPLRSGHGHYPDRSGGVQWPRPARLDGRRGHAEAGCDYHSAHHRGGPDRPGGLPQPHAELQLRPAPPPDFPLTGRKGVGCRCFAPGRVAWVNLLTRAPGATVVLGHRRRARCFRSGTPGATGGRVKLAA
jgi:hypothetical protein